MNTNRHTQRTLCVMIFFASSLLHGTFRAQYNLDVKGYQTQLGKTMKLSGLVVALKNTHWLMNIMHLMGEHDRQLFSLTHGKTKKLIKRVQGTLGDNVVRMVRALQQYDSAAISDQQIYRGDMQAIMTLTLYYGLAPLFNYAKTEAIKTAAGISLPDSYNVLLSRGRRLYNIGSEVDSFVEPHGFFACHGDISCQVFMGYVDKLLTRPSVDTVMSHVAMTYSGNDRDILALHTLLQTDVVCTVANFLCQSVQYGIDLLHTMHQYNLEIGSQGSHLEGLYQLIIDNAVLVPKRSLDALVASSAKHFSRDDLKQVHACQKKLLMQMHALNTDHSVDPYVRAFFTRFFPA